MPPPRVESGRAPFQGQRTTKGVDRRASVGSSEVACSFPCVPLWSIGKLVLFQRYLENRTKTLDDLYGLLRSGHVQAQGVVDTLADLLPVLDEGLDVSAANLAFLHTFGVEREEVLGWNLFRLADETWNTLELRLLLSEVFPKAQAILDYEVSLDVPQQGPRTFLLSARRLAHPDGNSTNLLLVFHDVTEASGLRRGGPSAGRPRGGAGQSPAVAAASEENGDAALAPASFQPSRQ